MEIRVAEVYHQETKYHEREMFRHQKRLDFSRQPLPYKTYQGGQKVILAPYLSEQKQHLLKEKKTEGNVQFGKGEIARLLHATNGLTGLLKYADGQSMALRAAPTAGGLYPTEIYLAIRAVPDFADGIYNFQVNDHSLVLVWEGDYWPSFQKYCMGHEAIESAHLLMILSAVYQRSTWRYADRAYRRILLDTGHILGNITAYAPEEGLTPYPMGGFFDSALNALMFLEPLYEGVLTVVALRREDSGHPLKPQVPSAISSQPHRPEMASKTRALQLHFASSIVKGKPDEKISLPASHLMSSLTLEGDNQIRLSPLSLDWPEGVGSAIRIRRSTRNFTGEAFMQEELASILEYAYAPTLLTPLFFYDPSLLTTYLIVQKVIGLPAGVYIYHPAQQSVSLVKAGLFHEATFHFCLGQELARDAATLVIHTAHLPTALNRYGDRAYRYLHLDAGHIGERINLAAIQMGLGVSGIGGFYDDEVNALLDLLLDSIIVYITTLGRA